MIVDKNRWELGLGAILLKPRVLVEML